MPRAADLTFDASDHALAREYVIANCEAGLGVKLEEKDSMLFNPKSQSTYSVAIIPGKADNKMSLALHKQTGLPLFGGASAWIAGLDASSSQLHLIPTADMVGFMRQAVAGGGQFQGLTLENGSTGEWVLCHINLGWAEGVKLVKKTAAMDKGGESFLYFRGSKLKVSEQFCHLHGHSYYSMLDGVASPTEIVETAYLNGQPGIALTDHGNMMGTYKLWEAGKEYGIKAMMGCEVYVVDDTGKKYVDAKGNNRRFEYHQTLIAMNEKGWQNLCELVSTASRDHFHYVPRVSHADIFRLKQGIICLSGCFKGMVAHHLTHFPPELTAEFPIYTYNPDWARQVMQTYKAEFGDRYFAEVHANDFARYMDAVPRIMQMADDCGVPKVIAQDYHYTVARDAILQRLLSRINSQKVDDLGGEGKDVTGPYYIRQRSEIVYPSFTPDMYDRTCEIMERCTLGFDHKGYLFPKYDLANDVDWNSYQAKVAAQ